MLPLTILKFKSCGKIWHDWPSLSSHSIYQLDSAAPAVNLVSAVPAANYDRNIHMNMYSAGTTPSSVMQPRSAQSHAAGKTPRLDASSDKNCRPQFQYTIPGRYRIWSKCYTSFTLWSQMFTWQSHSRGSLWYYFHLYTYNKRSLTLSLGLCRSF